MKNNDYFTIVMGLIICSVFIFIGISYGLINKKVDIINQLCALLLLVIGIYGNYLIITKIILKQKVKIIRLSI